MFDGSKRKFGRSPSKASALTRHAFRKSAFGKSVTAVYGQTSPFRGQQATRSIYDQAAAPLQRAGGLFEATTSTAFESTITAPTTFGGFSQPQQNISNFGAAAQNTSLFGQSERTVFGAGVRHSRLIGFGQEASTSLFGQQAATTSTPGGFGQAAATTTNVFGSGTALSFGELQGTNLVKYDSTVHIKSVMKSDQPSNKITKLYCISAMKEYEQKSLEELRMEDYIAGWKGPQAGSTRGGIFTFLENKGPFGQRTYGSATATAAFGAQAQQNNFMAQPFRATNTVKLAFRQTHATGQLGQQSAVSIAPTFGLTPSTRFSGFGATAGTQQPPLFCGTYTADATYPTFGIGAGDSTSNTGFGDFGTTCTSTTTGGVFFGANSTSGFGEASQANTGFGNFSKNNTPPTGSGTITTHMEL